MKMTRLHQWAIIVIVTIVALFGMSSSSTASETKDITIWAYDNWAKAAEKAVEIYQNNNPNSGYIFHVVAMGQDDMVQKVKVALSTGAVDALPDIFYDEDYNYAEYILYYGDMFHDLTPYFDLKKYYPFKTVNVTTDGATYAIPYDAGTGVMFYRTDLIQAAGLTDEDMDSLTWEQFIEIGKKVKQATGVDMIIMCPGGDMEGRIIYQSAGTWFFDANGQENIKNNQAFSDAFATMKSLYQAGIVWDVPGWDDYFAAIANGKAAALVGGSWWAPIISSYPEQSGLWRITQVPRLTGSDVYTNYSNLSGGNWFVIENENSEFASQFAVEMFANNQELADFMANEYYIVPTNRDLVAGLTVLPHPFWGSQDIITTLCQYNENVPSVVYGLNAYEMTYTVGPLVGEYISGKYTLDELLTKIYEAAVMIGGNS